MKRLLVPVYAEIEQSGVFALAGDLARDKGLHLTGVSAGSPFSIATYGSFAVQADLVYVERRAEETEAEDHKLFVDAMTLARIAQTPRGAAGAGFDWMSQIANEHVAIGEEARAFDMTVVALPGPKGTGCPSTVLDGCLFDSGRPVLVVPPQKRPTFGNTISIAWNGSSETARTIAFGMPLLQQAKSIIVQEIKGVGVRGPSAAAIAEQLALHGLPVEARTAESGRRQDGQAFMEEAERCGADLLFKGAYTQSRLRQIIFGGATAYLLANATLPMFMAH